ncbi:MAG: hypothetical protein LJE94_02645 [Deltaproteobacteria bacterium]|nr:hypothetical protein [Deltaproteobacteria bacterium]
MKINLEKDLQAVSSRLTALSKEIDRIAAGIGKPKKPKAKPAAGKAGSKGSRKTAAAQTAPGGQKEAGPSIEIDPILENGIAEDMPDYNTGADAPV